MTNPILQMLKGNQNQNNIISRISSVKSMLSGRNIDEVFNGLMRTNPKFKEFVEFNQGKSIEDIAMEYDLDVDLLKQFLK